MRHRTVWTQQQVDDLRLWHIMRMDECGYPDEIRAELTRNLRNFIGSLRIG
jgi:hypothetical protein